MQGEFEILSNSADEYLFVLKDGRGAVLLSSWGHDSNRECREAIDKVRIQSRDRRNFVKQMTPVNQYRFRLVAPNDEALGQGLLLGSQSDYETNIAQVRELAGDAKIVDRSVITRSKQPSAPNQPGPPKRPDRSAVPGKTPIDYKYFIFAASLAPNGEYGLHGGGKVYWQKFRTADGRDKVWQDVVEPNTVSQSEIESGIRYKEGVEIMPWGEYTYEYRRQVGGFKHGAEFVGLPRRANRLLEGLPNIESREG